MTTSELSRKLAGRRAGTVSGGYEHADASVSSSVWWSDALRRLRVSSLELHMLLRSTVDAVVEAHGRNLCSRTIFMLATC